MLTFCADSCIDAFMTVTLSASHHSAYLYFYSSGQSCDVHVSHGAYVCPQRRDVIRVTTLVWWAAAELWLTRMPPLTASPLSGLYAVFERWAAAVSH